MKVGVFLGNQSPEVGGGYTFQWDIFYSLTKLVDESNHDFVIFCRPEYVENVRSALQTSRIHIVAYQPTWAERVISLLRRELPIVRFLWKRPGRIDHVAHEAGVEFMWFVSAGSHFLDTPYLTIVWDLTHRLQPWFPEVSAQGEWNSREASYLWHLQRASVIIAGTEVGKKEIERFYRVPSERIRILPHPTPEFCLNAPDVPDESTLAKYGIPKDYLFYPAQFWSHKNHANLLLGIRSLRDKHGLTFPLVFVGSDKGNQEYVRQLIRQFDLSAQVHFLGFVPQSDMIGLYQNAFALTYLSFCGPENLPPLEAFAAGCPVIASDIPGAREQLGNAALLVDPGNPDEIALAIKSIYGDLELRNSLIQRGFERARRWTAQDFIRGVFEILDEFEPMRRCWGNKYRLR